MKKIGICLFTALFICGNLFSQEALKSFEEEYYDFLSLVGTVKQPAMGYRTLSDSYWKFYDEDSEFQEEIKEKTTSENNAEKTLDSEKQKKKIINPWENNNLGQKKYIRNNKRLSYKIYGPEWFSSINTEVPFGQNDGALWQGCGYNTSFTTGFHIEAYGFEATFKPTFNYAQNRDFNTVGNVYDYSWVKSKSFIDINVGDYHSQVKNSAGGKIDLVQRYGDSAYKKFDWGDSEIRYTFKNITAGFGTQSPWVGPAKLNPMLGSNNASSYLKGDIGFRRTTIRIPKTDITIGDIEFRAWIGKLEASDYYEEDKYTKTNLLNALTFSFAPAFIPGFYIGASRLILSEWKSKNLKHFFYLFKPSFENDVEDQKISLFADWKFSKVGLEVYGELGFDDGWYNFKANPFHTAIYTVGAKQYIPLPFEKIFKKIKNNLNIYSVLSFEWNNFEMSQDFQLQWPYLGYFASSYLHGYTHDGQILGAGSGSFGNSQMFKYEVLYPKGSTAIKFHRYCPNNNVIYSQGVYSSSLSSGALENGNSDYTITSVYWSNFETYISFGISTKYFITKSLVAQAEYDYVDIINFRYKSSKTNHYFQWSLKYNF